MSRAVVVGAGIAGLTTAHELAHHAAGPIDVVCVDAEPRAGGMLRSERDRGFLVEWAANGFLDDAPATLELVRRLGLDGRLVRARPEAAKRRFIYARHKLRELPSSPTAFLRSGILSHRGVARLLTEPFVSARPAGAPEETVHEFAARRVGEEAAATLVDALVSGLWAGDAKRLSLPASFPKLYAMEAAGGSLLRGLGGGGLGPRGQLASFPAGLAELPQALASRLGPRLHLATPLERLSHLGTRGFRLHFREGAPEEVPTVVLACPASAAARIIEGMDAALARELRAIETAPIAVVHFGYRRDALPARADGFGFLAPRGAGLRILGTLWASDIFDGRAPAGSQLLTTMVGGATDPHAADLDDATLVHTVQEDLATAMAALPDPYFTCVIRHRTGIPQYNTGHRERLAAIEARLAQYPGLMLTGASYRGVSVNDCIADARAVAQSIAVARRAPESQRE